MGIEVRVDPDVRADDRHRSDDAVRPTPPPRGGRILVRACPVAVACDAWHALSMNTVLIVDDHASFRLQARTVLESDGFDVVGEASDGVSGLAAARSLRPDLVLLDIGLPDVEGFEVAQALALDGPPPYVVLTSSREASAYGPRLATSRVLGFIAKDELSGAAIRALAADS
jgi:two-component system response regulator EvgA